MAYVDGELPAADRRRVRRAPRARARARGRGRARARAARERCSRPTRRCWTSPCPPACSTCWRCPTPNRRRAAAANDPLSPSARNDAHRAGLPHARRWHWRRVGRDGRQPGAGRVVRHARARAGRGGRRRRAGARRRRRRRHHRARRAARSARAARGRHRARPNVRRGGGPELPQPRAAVLPHVRAGRRVVGHRVQAGRRLGGGEPGTRHRPAPARPALAAGAYRTAASPFSPALLQAVDALRDGDTLDAAAEAAARAKGWKP